MVILTLKSPEIHPTQVHGITQLFCILNDFAATRSLGGNSGRPFEGGGEEVVKW